jgi:hypothetical protein
MFDREKVLLYERSMHTVPTIIDTIGGSGKFARELGIKPSAASEMKRRQSIPVKYWPDLVAICKNYRMRGISYNLLVNIHQPRKASINATERKTS